MGRKQKRLAGIGAIGVVLSFAVGLVMVGLRDEIVFFYTPSDIVEKNKAAPGQRFRLGGMVKESSLNKGATTISFIITDTNSDILVNFSDILPELFREGQGVVAEGTMNSDMVFIADTVLAKHDENYMPKEVADALKKQGYTPDMEKGS